MIVTLHKSHETNGYSRENMHVYDESGVLNPKPKTRHLSERRAILIDEGNTICKSICNLEIMSI